LEMKKKRAGLQMISVDSRASGIDSRNCLAVLRGLYRT
jgi:hypothetical protein